MIQTSTVLPEGDAIDLSFPTFSTELKDRKSSCNLKLSLLCKAHTYEEIWRGCHQPAKLNLDERDEYTRALVITWATLLMCHRMARWMIECSRTVQPAELTHRMRNGCLEVLMARCSP